jgi:hypothetical protein
MASLEQFCIKHQPVMKPEVDLHSSTTTPLENKKMTRLPRMNGFRNLMTTKSREFTLLLTVVP